MTIAELERALEVQQHTLRMAGAAPALPDISRVFEQHKQQLQILRGGPFVEAQRTARLFNELYGAQGLQAAFAAQQLALRPYNDLMRQLNAQALAPLKDLQRILSQDAFAQALRTVKALGALEEPLANGVSQEAEATTEAFIARVRALPAAKQLVLVGALVDFAQQLTELAMRMQSERNSPISIFSVLHLALAMWTIALVLGLLGEDE